MSQIRRLKTASLLLVAGATASGVSLLAQNGTPGVASRIETPPAANAYDGPVYEVKLGNSIVNLIETGYLEAARSVDVYNRVEGQTIIIRLAAEGSRVKTGDVVCELDSASLRDQLVNQRISTKSAEADFENAKLARQVSEIAVEQYVKGTFRQEQNTLRNEIVAAKTAVRIAESRLERTKKVRKQLNDMPVANGGGKTSAELLTELDIEDRIEGTEQSLEREKMALGLAEIKQEILERYIRDKTTKELTIDVVQKRSAELAKQAAWELQKSRESKLERSIAACTLIAPDDGLVVYANDPNRAGRPPVIEEGATVRERQKIFSLPDISQLQVNLKVNESQIDRVAPNMKAMIRVNAFADQVLNGRVLLVAPLPDPSNSLSGDRKVYTTKVGIANRLPGLRPGMSAQVEIRINEQNNMLGVPVEAVVLIGGKDHVAVKTPGGGFAWREVTVGVSNGKFVAIQHGIQVDERLALDPRALMSEDEKGDALRGSSNWEPVKPADPGKARAKGRGGRVLSSPLLQKLRNISPDDRVRMKSASPDERVEILKKAGFTEDDL